MMRRRDSLDPATVSYTSGDCNVAHKGTPAAVSVLTRQSFQENGRAKESCVQYRYVLIVLGFFGLVSVYALRVSLNVAIVSMVNHTAVLVHTQPSNCIVDITTPSRTPPHSEVTVNASYTAVRARSDGPFVWDPATQGLVLGAFYWGYVVTPIPGGTLAEKFGAKWLFGGGTLLTALLGLLIPTVTREYGHVGLIIIRVLQGAGEGVTYPAIETQIAHWIPKHQRTTAVSFIHAGGFLGVVVGMFVSGELAASAWGWPSIFYVFSAFTFLWFFAWIVFTSNRPEEHFLISQDELNLILNDLGDQKPTHGARTPWLAILTSPAAWASHVALFGTLWLQFTLVTLLPTYLGTVLLFDIRSNGFYSALPYVGAIIAVVAAGPLADLIRRKGWLTATGVRKTFNATALIIPSMILCTVVQIAGCDGMLSLVLFVLAGSIRGISKAGCCAIPIDMAPDFAGTLFGISVSIGSFSGILVPYVTGALTKHDNSTTNWSYSFYITGAIGVFSGIFFQVFASAEVQEWGLAESQAPNTDKNDLQLRHVDEVTVKNVLPRKSQQN